MWRDALSLLEEMEQEGVEANTITLNAAMDAWVLRTPRSLQMSMMETCVKLLKGGMVINGIFQQYRLIVLFSTVLRNTLRRGKYSSS